MEKNKTLFDNSRLFVIYGLLNLILLLCLLGLIILLFNEIYILPRTVFVLIIGVQTVLIFFIRVQFLKVEWNDGNQTIDILYNRKFGVRWRKNATHVVLPLAQFDGYTAKKDGLGLWTIGFFKIEMKERYELGPFQVGIISARELKSLEESFGQSL